jgi:hypothetical protein
MLLSNDQTVEPQEAMSQLFPSFQSDEERLHFCYLPSVTRECCVCHVDGTGSGSCPMADYGISCVEPSGSATRELDN